MHYVNNKDNKMEKMLVVAMETSGLNVANAIGVDRNLSNHYQIISLGLVVCNSKYEKIDEFYIEIQYDGKSLWDKQAEKHHGLNKGRLKEYGLPEVKALEEIGSFIYDHFGNSKIPLIGHNTHFSLTFLDALFRRYDIVLTFDCHYYDLATLGKVFLNSCNKKTIFALLDLKNDKRNSLNTARNILKAFQRFKSIV